MKFALWCLVSACLVASAVSAHAQSYIDLSVPMTGKSRFVFNADGTPAEFGVGSNDKQAPLVATGGGRSTDACCGAGYGATGPAMKRPKTQHVSGYVRGNGTVVAPYVRGAPRRR